MLKNAILFILFLVTFFLQSSVTTIPLALLFLLLLIIVVRKEIVLLLAIIAGAFLDSLTLHAIGKTSVFFLFFLSLVLIYERKFEIRSYPFIAFATFFGVLLYMLYMKDSFPIYAGVICSIFCVAIFSICNKIFLHAKKEKKIT